MAAIARFASFVANNEKIGPMRDTLKLFYYPIDWMSKVTEVSKEALIFRKLLSSAKNMTSIVDLPKKAYKITELSAQMARELCRGDFHDAAWTFTELTFSELTGTVGALNDVASECFAAGVFAGVVTAATMVTFAAFNMSCLIIGQTYSGGKAIFEVYTKTSWKYDVDKKGEYILKDGKRYHKELTQDELTAAEFKLGKSASYITAGVTFFVLSPAHLLFLAAMTSALAFSLLASFYEYKPG